MTAFERVVEAFEAQGLAVTPRGAGRASAQAPGHTPADRSVTITATEGRCLLHSHSDLTEQVLDALGLTWTDLYDSPSGYKATYPDGRSVHWSVDKKYRQTGNTKGRSLYRVEFVGHDTVYVTEGEKDVHAVEAVGAAATCSAQGAGKAHLADWEPLRGKNVVVVRDKDEPGRRHADQVAAQLDGIAAVVVIVEAATGKDAADHIAAGLGLDEFVPVEQDMDSEDYARPRVWRATELECARRVEWLAANRLPLAAVTYMLGPEGIGKSLWTIWLLALITTGKPFAQFGIPARTPQIVVLVLTEDPWSTVVRPRLEVAGANLDYVRVICAERDGSGSPTFPQHMDVVAEAAIGAALVVVDAWADTLPGSLSVKDPQHARRALHPWKELSTRTGVSVLLTGHTNREKGGNVRNAYGLTGELRKKARMTILAQPDPDEDGVLVIGPEKSNLTAQVQASRFRIESVQVFDQTADSDGTVPRLVWIGDAEQSAKDFFADAAAADQGDGSDDRNDVDEWLTAFLAHGSQKATEVYSAADANGFSKDQIKRSKRRVGAVAERPQNPGPWFWSIPSQKQGAGSTGDPVSTAALPALPALPDRSAGVQQGAGSTGSGVQETRQAVDATTPASPEIHLCALCGEPCPTNIRSHLECVEAKQDAHRLRAVDAPTPPEVRTPGRQPGQWLKSGEPVGEGGAA